MRSGPLGEVGEVVGSSPVLNPSDGSVVDSSPSLVPPPSDPVLSPSPVGSGVAGSSVSPPLAPVPLVGSGASLVLPPFAVSSPFPAVVPSPTTVVLLGAEGCAGCAVISPASTVAVAASSVCRLMNGGAQRAAEED